MGKKINVYLDDRRRCPKGFIWARNMEECLLLLESSPVHILSLDHDLGWDEPNGFALAKRMVEHAWYADIIYLHSSSAIGRMNMYQLLYRYKPDQVQLYNGAMPQSLLDRIAEQNG